MKATHQKTLGSNEKKLILVFWGMGQALYQKRRLIRLLAAAAEKGKNGEDIRKALPAVTEMLS